MRSRLIKLAGLFAALVMLLALSACGGGDDSGASSSVPDSSFAQSGADSSTQGTSDVQSTADSGAGASSAAAPVQQAAAAAVQPNLGRYTHLDEVRYPEGRAPWLELQEDGRAVFQVNSGSVLGTATGSYVVSGSRLVVTIENLEISEDFFSSGITTLVFEVLNYDNLRYTGDAYGLTQKGNVFTLAGAEYSEDPVPAASVSEAPPESDSQTEVSSAPSAPAGSSDAGTTGSTARPPESTPDVSDGGGEGSEGGGFPWVIVIAVGALVLGAVAAVVIMSVLRRGKKAAAQPAEGEGAEEGKTVEESTAAKKRQATQEEKEAMKAAAKAEKLAVAKEKEAAKAAKAAEKAKAKADKSARAAELAREKATEAELAAAEATRLAAAAAAAKAAADATIQAAAQANADAAEQAVLEGQEPPPIAAPQLDVPPEPEPEPEPEPAQPERTSIFSERLSSDDNDGAGGSLLSEAPAQAGSGLSPELEIDLENLSQLPAGGGVPLDELDLEGEEETTQQVVLGGEPDDAEKTPGDEASDS